MGTTTTSSTTTSTLGKPISCVAWGDPHFVTFDLFQIFGDGWNSQKKRVYNVGGDWALENNVMPEVKSAGVHWMVKSSRVEVQGRFRNRGWITGLAVGGGLLDNHRLVLDKFDGHVQVSWDGQLVQDPSTFVGGGDIRLSMEGSGSNVKKIEVELPEDVYLKITGFSKPTVKITMRKQPSQDGLCGNANQDLSDETQTQLMAKWGAEIPQGESLFGQGTSRRLRGDRGVPAPLGDAEACAQQRQQYEALCREKMADAGPSITEVLLAGCVTDVCASGAEEADNAAQVGKEILETLDAAAGKSTTTLVGEGCCKPWRTILANTPKLTKSECATQCFSTSYCNAFAISGCSGSSDETCGGQCHLYLMDSQEEAHSGVCYEEALNGNTFCYSVQ